MLECLGGAANGHDFHHAMSLEVIATVIGIVTCTHRVTAVQM